MSPLTTILYSAAASPLGLLLWSPDPARTRQKLYSARRAALDPTLAGLQIRLWPDNLIVLCHDIECQEEG